MFPQGSTQLFCTCTDAFTYVNVPSCPTMFCEALAPMHAAGVCAPRLFALFVHTPAPVHAWSQCCCCCAVSSLMLSTCAWIPCVCCSAILRSSIVPGLSPPPSLPFFLLYLYYNYRCNRCASSLLCGASWLGCQDLPVMGKVSSRSWLPIVEAPGCQGGHSPSI